MFPDFWMKAKNTSGGSSLTPGASVMKGLSMRAPDHLGKLIGNTGSPTALHVALLGSFTARRGEFVRIPHVERKGDAEADCLGRIVSLSRTNVLFSEALGEGVGDVNVLPGSMV